MALEIVLDRVLFGLDEVEITVILEPKEHQMFDYAMKRNIHNEMLDCYFNQKWKKSVTICMELKGEFHGKLDHYYAAMRKRIHEYDNCDTFRLIGVAFI